MDTSDHRHGHICPDVQSRLRQNIFSKIICCCKALNLFSFFSLGYVQFKKWSGTSVKLTAKKLVNTLSNQARYSKNKSCLGHLNGEVRIKRAFDRVKRIDKLGFFLKGFATIVLGATVGALAMKRLVNPLYR